MLDLTRVQQDLQSSTYGAMSHLVDVIGRLIRVDMAVALCRNTDGGRQTVFISQRLEEAQSASCHTLLKWPTDPRSGFWRACWDSREDCARLLEPGNPTDAGWCHEIADATSLPELREATRCLSLSLATAPVCRVLFVRPRGRQAFEAQDPGRVMRYAGPCRQLIRTGCGRDQCLSRGGAEPVRCLVIQPTDVDLLQSLSGAERRVLQRLRLLETERQAAEALGRSPNTIHVHVKSIYRKLRVTKRSELLSLIEGSEPDRTRTVA